MYRVDMQLSRVFRAIYRLPRVIRRPSLCFFKFGILGVDLVKLNLRKLLTKMPKFWTNYKSTEVVNINL
jgi:hypothetical protein